MVVLLEGVLAKNVPLSHHAVRQFDVLRRFAFYL